MISCARHVGIWEDSRPASFGFQIFLLFALRFQLFQSNQNKTKQNQKTTFKKRSLRKRFFCFDCEIIFCFHRVVINGFEPIRVQVLSSRSSRACHVPTQQTIFILARVFILLDYPWAERETVRSIHLSSHVWFFARTNLDVFTRALVLVLVRLMSRLVKRHTGENVRKAQQGANKSHCLFSWQLWKYAVTTMLLKNYSQRILGSNNNQIQLNQSNRAPNNKT